MLDTLRDKELNAVAVGDIHVTPQTIEDALRTTSLSFAHIDQVFWGPKDKVPFGVPQLNIERGGPNVEPYAPALDDLIESADLLAVHFCPIPGSLIKKAKNLKAVCVSRGGFENIDVAAASAQNIPVINVIRNAIPVAEFTLGMMLCATRNIATSHHSLIEGKWRREYPNSGFSACLQNQVVGLCGLGNVGIELALRLKALGVGMLAWDPYKNDARLRAIGLEDIEFVDSLEEIFSRSDIISLHLRLTPETEKCIDKRLFSLMKPSAFFINSARGGLVAQDDLADAVKSKRIAGAALDVFDTEPLRQDAGLVGLENLTITPHIAGTTIDALEKSPFLLTAEVEKILVMGLTDRIVNYADITI